MATTNEDSEIRAAEAVQPGEGTEQQLVDAVESAPGRYFVVEYVGDDRYTWSEMLSAGAAQPDDERPPLDATEAVETATAILSRLCKAAGWTHRVEAVALDFSNLLDFQQGRRPERPDDAGYVVTATVTDVEGDEHEVRVTVDEGSVQYVHLDAGNFAVNY